MQAKRKKKTKTGKVLKLGKTLKNWNEVIQELSQQSSRFDDPFIDDPDIYTEEVGPRHNPSNYRCPKCQDLGHPGGNPNEYCNCKYGRKAKKEEKGFSAKQLAKPFDNGMKRQQGSNNLQAALDAISKLPAPEFSLKDSPKPADSTQCIALAALESVERLCLSGLSGVHSVRYLRSVLASTRDGQFPHKLNPYTAPILEALGENNGTEQNLPSGNRGSSVQVDRTKKRKKTSRK